MSVIFSLLSFLVWRARQAEFQNYPEGAAKLWESPISRHSIGKKLGPAYHNIRRIPDYLLSNILFFSPKIATLRQASKIPGEYTCFWPDEAKMGIYKMSLEYLLMPESKVMLKK